MKLPFNGAATTAVIHPTFAAFYRGGGVTGSFDFRLSSPLDDD